MHGVSIISCTAPYGKGGLGQRLREVVEEMRSGGEPVAYFCGQTREDDPAGVTVSAACRSRLLSGVISRMRPGWRCHWGSNTFDRRVSRLLVPPIKRFVGFAGQALHSFKRVRDLGDAGLELIAPTAHVAYTYRRYAEAVSRHPIESTWLSSQQRDKTLKEYDLADAIWVASDYVADTFLQEGVLASKLKRIPTDVDTRFTATRGEGRDDVFRVIYTGGITVAKGVPLLLEAFEQIDVDRKHLTLVGGWGTRGMRKFVANWMRFRANATIGAGDPLPHLQIADAYVHPSWQDGFGRAPLEAMRCGVPVVVSADTGMKELISDERCGFVVPTGDVAAIVERLEVIAARRELSRTTSAPATALSPGS